MGVAISQQITRYYDQYRDAEVTFSKEIIRTIRLDPRQVYIKCNLGQWPCIVNSASFQMAKIIVGTKGGAYKALADKNTTGINLRFCFFESGNNLMSFFVAARVKEISPYMASSDLAVITLSFTQRPPDDFIEIMGNLLDACSNFVTRRDERIILNDDSKRKLSLLNSETVVDIMNVPRHCIVRDLSFTGAKIILVGLPQFLTNKQATLHLDFTDPDETISLSGKTVSAEPIEGRRDVIAVNVQFDEAKIPLQYKIHVNTFLTSLRKLNMTAKQQIAMQRQAQANIEQMNERRREIQEQAQREQNEGNSN